jgi:hypothetical protein
MYRFYEPMQLNFAFLVASIPREDIFAIPAYIAVETVSVATLS